MADGRKRSTGPKSGRIVVASLPTLRECNLLAKRATTSIGEEWRRPDADERLPHADPPLATPQSRSKRFKAINAKRDAERAPPGGGDDDGTEGKKPRAAAKGTTATRGAKKSGTDADVAVVGTKGDKATTKKKGGEANTSADGADESGSAADGKTSTRPNKKRKLEESPEQESENEGDERAGVIVKEQVKDEGDSED